MSAAKIAADVGALPGNDRWKDAVQAAYRGPTFRQCDPKFVTLYPRKAKAVEERRSRSANRSLICADLGSVAGCHGVLRSA